MVQNKSGKTVKHYRTDNGMKFLSDEFLKLSGEGDSQA